MYLKRHIDTDLLKWKNDPDKKPCLLFGIRQSGKTESLLHFGKENYKHVIYINFWNDKEYAQIFSNSIEVDHIISLISLRFPDTPIEEKNTLLIFDEIQDCPRARLSLKNFALDKRYDVIASGSFLGINGYNLGEAVPSPVGYEQILTMKAMDFEEFLWANGYTEDQLEILEKHFDDFTPMDPYSHSLFRKLYSLYLCIGGYPKAVLEYVEKKNLLNSLNIVKDNIQEIQKEFGRRIDKNGNPIFKPSEVARIHSAFSLIPFFLAKENKRYIVSKIDSGNSIDKKDALDYLADAGLVKKVYNLILPSLPHEANRIASQFKLFPCDIGILISLFGYNTALGILNGNLDQNKGAIYEAAVFDSLYKSDMDVYYFAKESGLEVDFVISYLQEPYLLEVKARNGNCKSSKTIMKNKEKYGDIKLIKISDNNIGKEGDIITLPHYMTYLLGKKDKEYRNKILESFVI